MIQSLPCTGNLQQHDLIVIWFTALCPLQVTSAKQLMATIEAGQNRRHVASTNMNRESSRSHLIMSVIIESTNLQTQNVAKGKLSFVDLAGSERCAGAMW